MSPDVVQQIRELRQQGLDQHQIARRLELPVEDVEREIYACVNSDMIEFVHWGAHY
jgi:DNA-binding transcriptional regulator LsrR (DeoR family)